MTKPTFLRWHTQAIYLPRRRKRGPRIYSHQECYACGLCNQGRAGGGVYSSTGTRWLVLLALSTPALSKEIDILIS